MKHNYPAVKYDVRFDDQYCHHGLCWVHEGTGVTLVPIPKTGMNTAWEILKPLGFKRWGMSMFNPPEDGSWPKKLFSVIRDPRSRFVAAYIFQIAKASERMRGEVIEPSTHEDPEFTKLLQNPEVNAHPEIFIEEFIDYCKTNPYWDHTLVPQMAYLVDKDGYPFDFDILYPWDVYRRTFPFLADWGLNAAPAPKRENVGNNESRLKVASVIEEKKLWPAIDEMYTMDWTLYAEAKEGHGVLV